MIKYIGSKRTLVPAIVEIVSAIPEARTVCDLFTGTTRVAQGLKRAGYFVTANDAASYSEVLARTYIEADASRIDAVELDRKLAHLSSLPGRRGYFTETFCVRSRYFQPHNGERIDAIRPEIDRIATDPFERAILLTSLMEAADRVDSTTGLQMAYLKDWAPRSYNDLQLRLPRLIAGAGKALRTDANELAPSIDADVCYIDPPYNQHSYFSNYHVWETLVRNDEPGVYGVACKRIDCRTTKSLYNSKRNAWAAFEALIRSLRSEHLVVSFNDEGYFEREAIEDLLRDARESVAAVPVDFKRYVGAQIGIYNPQGEKVGRVSHLRNREFLFVAGAHAARVVAAMGDGAGERLVAAAQ